MSHEPDFATGNFVEDTHKLGPRPRPLALIASGLGAAAIGVYIVTVSLDLVMPSLMVLGPLAILIERRRAARLGCVPGIVRLVTVSLVVLAGVVAPVKYRERALDHRVPLHRCEMTLRELAESCNPRVIAHVSPSNEAREQVIHFPSENPSVRQIMRAIESQTGLRCYLPFGCANGTSILRGPPSSGLFYVSEPDPCPPSEP